MAIIVSLRRTALFSEKEKHLVSHNVSPSASAAVRQTLLTRHSSPLFWFEYKSVMTFRQC